MPKFEGNITYNEKDGEFGLTYERVKELHQHRVEEDSSKQLDYTGEKPAEGSINRNTTHLNLVKGNGYALVEFDVAPYAEGRIHSHHHSCLSGVVKGGIAEVDYLPNADGKTAYPTGFAIRYANSRTNRVTRPEALFTFDPEGKDTHQILGSNVESKLYHIYPVQDSLVEKLLDKLKVNGFLDKAETESALSADTNKNFYEIDSKQAEKNKEVREKIAKSWQARFEGASESFRVL